MLAWVDSRLAEAGLKRTGELEPVRERPWASVWKLPTSGGLAWLKLAAPGTAFEAGLYALLGRVAPERILQPIAVDVERGWILLPDGGEPVGQARLESVLPAYARLQRTLAPYADELVALGVTDMRPAVMPLRFEEALSHHPPLEALRGAFADWCGRLAHAPGAPSLDHNDLHGANAFEGPVFYDWGDSVVAHPFSSLLVVRAVLDGTDYPRARDAYLAGFADLAPHAELVATAELAIRVAHVARALVWVRAAAGSSEWSDGPARHLAALLDG